MRKAGMLALVVAAGVALGNCKGEKAANPARAGVAKPGVVEPAAPPEQKQAAPPVREETKVQLTDDKLDRYLKYQQSINESVRKALKDLESMAGRADAGRYAGATGGVAAVGDSSAIVQRQSEEKERAVKNSGLDAGELPVIERMVGAVLTRRTLMKNLDMEGSIKQMETMAAQMPADKRKEFQQSIDEARKNLDETRSLRAERAEFGDANIDLILKHEAAFAKLWNEQTAAAGKQ